MRKQLYIRASRLEKIWQDGPSLMVKPFDYCAYRLPMNMLLQVTMVGMPRTDISALLRIAKKGISVVFCDAAYKPVLQLSKPYQSHGILAALIHQALVHKTMRFSLALWFTEQGQALRRKSPWQVSTLPEAGTNSSSPDQVNNQQILYNLLAHTCHQIVARHGVSCSSLAGDYLTGQLHLLFLPVLSRCCQHEQQSKDTSADILVLFQRYRVDIEFFILSTLAKLEHVLVNNL
jgi:hypothetical protein